MWYNDRDIRQLTPIIVNDLRGFVLPHAGTQHTSHIISHTLRFQPDKKLIKRIKQVYILYYPASTTGPNVGDQYHEYYTVQKAFSYVWRNYWVSPDNSHEKKIQEPRYIGIDLRAGKSTHLKKIDLKHSFIIVSADFSHGLNMQSAITLENCAAHSILQRNFNNPCISVIDHSLQFKTLYNIIPESWVLQWVGRTRSSGEKGVGYLSFLIRDNRRIPRPDGIFVTAYDNAMRQRECLGEWYSKDYGFTKRRLKAKVADVLDKAATTSRLTGGMHLTTPIHSYTVTYLYRERDTRLGFIRGWHGIKYSAFYLSDVFLENTFDNGRWIQLRDKVWTQEYTFAMEETLSKLDTKAGRINKSSNSFDYTLYNSRVVHKKIENDATKNSMTVKNSTVKNSTVKNSRGTRRLRDNRHRR